MSRLVLRRTTNNVEKEYYRQSTEVVIIKRTKEYSGKEENIGLL